MVLYKRYFLPAACLVLVLLAIAAGCTSSGSSSGSSDQSTGVAEDPGEFHSTFAELAGTYVSADDASSSIILYPDGAATVVKGDVRTDTSIYMEMEVLYLADGTSIGPYPIRDDTLVYEGVQYQKQ